MFAQPPIVYALSESSIPLNTPVRFVSDGWVGACDEADSFGVVATCLQLTAEKWRIDVRQNQRPSTSLAQAEITKSLEFKVDVGLFVTQPKRPSVFDLITADCPNVEYIGQETRR